MLPQLILAANISSALVSTAIPGITMEQTTTASMAPSAEQSPTSEACPSGHTTVSTTMGCRVTFSCIVPPYPCPTGQTLTRVVFPEKVATDIDGCITSVRSTGECYGCQYCDVESTASPPSTL
ncbi:hypothetical protein QBC33DRAFT_218565 [Phialemonium atrogriseum]|uniref:Uncharacterized protein n=1 Tax=Phialemonium atrogriseum TaxID=1093897 RepID=A0AAJ0FQ15_9PEZI|nr:uncharacterized protein QBC33DRAFT_218565 [Phialemonium atrogriseum]KAK1770833.1 hypothetical protein QBC33DRAFT_218565 [Phialemonium atrogriseum]